MQPTRVERQASAFSDDEQTEELAISGLVQDEEGYPLANIEVLAEPIGPPAADTSMEIQALKSRGQPGLTSTVPFISGTLPMVNIGFVLPPWTDSYRPRSRLGWAR